MRIYINIFFIGLLLLLCRFGIAQKYEVPQFGGQDSIVVELSERFGLHYKHHVKAKQTLYSLSKFFGTSLEAIYDLNPYIREREILEGELIIIPVDSRVIQTDPDEIDELDNKVPIFYRVRQKDNLFRISRRLFDQSTLELMRRNRLNGFSLEPHSLLHVGWIVSELDHSQRQLIRDSIVLARKNMLFGPEEAMEYTLHSTRGIAIWDQKHPDQNSLYVLHSNAKPNSIIELIYPMLNRKVYAKVIGKIPEKLYPRDVSAIISPGVAQALGAKDARFLIEMRYYQ